MKSKALKTPSLETTLRQAITHHQEGRLQEAEQLYRAILHTRPNQPDANHNLGVLACQMGRHADALPFLKAALAINPRNAQYALSCAEALLANGQPQEGLAILDRAMKHGADSPIAQSLRQRLLAAQDNQAAARELERLIALFNDGHFAALESETLVLIDKNPNSGVAWKILGAALQMQGKDGLPAMKVATQLLPGDADAHNNLGAAFRNAGQLEEAVASYRRALEIRPDFAEARNNLGVALQDLGQLDDAVTSYRLALQINPNYAEAHSNLGNALSDLGQFDEAVASYRLALEIRPDYAQAHANLGNALSDLEQFDDAVASYHRALGINPNLAEVFNNLGVAEKDIGRMDDAVASIRRALELKPDWAGAHSSLLFFRSNVGNISAMELFAEHCRFGEQFESPLRKDWPWHNNIQEPDRRLQIGFVSADLRKHSVAAFIEPVLEHLAKCSQLSLHVYYNHGIEDDFTRRLRRLVARWNPVRSLSDAALAEKIRADGIDILIDLSGHTAGNRLLAFARKPAPLQASWIGYPGTTGLRAMDYYLADRHFLPVEQFASQFTEKIVHLPANAPFLPAADAPAVNPLPALSNGYVTFGSFNRIGKISLSAIAIWAQLLRALPGSRMLLGGLPEESHCDSLLASFAQEGIGRERLSLHPRGDMASYLELHHQVDLCLDTFPYTGGTTSCHALWMGVPTLTLAGETPGGRQGAAILGGVGLEAMIACDAQDFVRKGVAWAGQPDALAAIRSQLRERFAQSAIGQPALVAEGLERVLRTMWQRWCAGLPPAHF